MKCLLIILIVFVIVVDSDTSKRLFLPQLPIGEYRVNVLGVIRCDSIQSNDQIKFNLYLSKTSANTSEIKGNITNSVPVDDSLDVEINMAVKDSIGGWKENAHIFKKSKACSSIKSFFGDSWTQITDSLGIYNATCPIPAGLYRGPGLNTDEHLFSNFPKKFFYGTYKMRVHYEKNNIVYGCITFVLEVKRPWETD
ncbi:uncharacterized protein LOC107884034 [Acyrthosiphon pisum]|uniref:MD-2-related lipid-recognition domain-containing protein n=1 Tax=Acyrthosiphon pisum TaxID=7029 RepID=A0A8R2D506_ACYPI|nr:uncharacterized protein LOC107884034 [Acyrthosiphon pisum]|eukprot:XP_016660864.1 PREDICTED: uncharacterized protein LOC107884034 [Acyrthosiphon pisum]